MIDEVRKHKCWYCPVCQTICELTPAREALDCQHCTYKGVKMEPIAGPSLRLNVEILNHLQRLQDAVLFPDWPEYAVNQHLIDKLKDLD